MIDQIWRLHLGTGPLIAVAVHDGHDVRQDVAEHLALSESERLREEDPFTGGWTEVAPTRVVGMRSRFEVDLNRPREKAVYRQPEDAWGLKVWKTQPPREVFDRSLMEYDAFYEAMQKMLGEISQVYGRFVVFDLHSYNHRRNGHDGPTANQEENPQVNIGTGTMDRKRWAPIVDTFIGALQSYNYPEGKLDVRENVKFRGGQFSRWVHETFPETGCSIAIEFKKFFMDEWTGKANSSDVGAIREALRFTVPGVLASLKNS